MAREMEDDLFIEADDIDAQEDKYLLFPVGNETYGIEIRFIREIVELQPITIIPDIPHYMKGVINLRGRIIPVMDIRLRFGMEEKTYTDRTCIIIIEINELLIGIIVDTVAEVQEIAKTNIEQPTVFKHTETKEYYIAGLGKINNSVKILIDINHLLCKEDVQTLEQKTQKLTEKE